MTAAFTGVRIVEFGQAIAGPFAAAMLGYLGAEVIKVESPGEGDQSRRLMDSGPLAAAGMAPLYQGMNPGKRSITVDLKHPAAKEIVERLISRADVVIQNYRVGVLDRLGFSYESLKAVKPDLIYCAISGYGQTGPRRDAPAYDGAVQAASGIMSVTGVEGGGPMKVGFAVVDSATALTAAFAVAGALYRRAMTGEGQYLDVSMLDTAISLLSPLVTTYLIGGTEPAQLGNMSLTRLPTADVFPAGKGYVQVSAITDAQCRLFCDVIQRSDLLEDPRFATAAQRLQHAGEMREEIVAALASATAREWEARLSAVGVPASAVLTIPEALQEPQLAERSILIDLPANEATGQGPTTVVNAGFRATPDGPWARRPAPTLGHDTRQVLEEIGYSAEEIAALADAGAI
jgi:CoA:oxalate CoA-transferase